MSIFEDFLEHSHAAGQALAAESDVLSLARLPVSGIGIWMAQFEVAYLAQGNGGVVEMAPGPLSVAIHFGHDYLRQVSPLEVAQVGEADFFHPNFRWPVLCLGEVGPGMPLPQVLRHVYEIITYQNFATADGLNPVACRRLVEEPELLDLLPLAPPLVRRRLGLNVSLDDRT